MKKTSIAIVATATLLSGALLGINSSSASTKNITCYKGTTSKVVTTAKCPTGFTTTKPTATPIAPKPTTTKGGSFAINATYKGKLNTVWGDSGVSASGISLVGSGNTAGLDILTGSGSSAPSSQCEAIDGDGVLGSGADTVKVSFDSSTKGCAAEGAAPTVVTLTGNATVVSGTGKFAGATGILKANGTFKVKATDAGSKDSEDLILTLVGTITTK